MTQKFEYSMSELISAKPNKHYLKKILSRPIMSRNSKTNLINEFHTVTKHKILHKLFKKQNKRLRDCSACDIYFPELANDPIKISHCNTNSRF